MLVREKPPLRLDIDIETPSGRHHHWSEQELDPAHVPSGVSFTSTMPGGFAELSATLPRKRGVTYSDLERLSNVTVHGPGGDVAWQGRLERSPRSSGGQLSVSPGCVGWQAHLEDDKTAREIYRDIDLTHWGEPSAQERIDQGATPLHQASVRPDDNGVPALETLITAPWAAAAGPGSEAWYDARGLGLGSVYYAWKRAASLPSGDSNWTWWVRLLDRDHWNGAVADATANLRAAGPGSGTLTATTAVAKTFAEVELFYATVADTNNGRQHAVLWTALCVSGDHGLVKQGIEPDAGLLDADVVAHAVGKWCPLLNFSTGAGGTVQPSGFVIPHLVFLEETTAAEMVRQASRFTLPDWGVWENRTFHWAKRGAFGRSWRARASESQLEETGEDTARLWNGAVVEYKDVSGSTRTVGPTGSGADTESADLTDADTQNPANQLGIRRWTKLSMGVSTPAGATEVGRRFLEETKLLDSSGRARVVGHVEDSHGVVHPAWRMRAGDSISFPDASDSSARRIVSGSYSHPDRSCSVDLDAPPDSMAALLERLDVSIVGLGL